MTNEKKIFVVDDNEANLSVCKEILKTSYTVYPFVSAAKMFDLLNHVTPDLILLDVEMPETNGYEAIKLLKKFESFRDIPVIFLSAMNDAQSEAEGLNLGAADYIHKPFISTLLLRRVELHLTLEKYRKLLEEHGIPVTE